MVGWFATSNSRNSRKRLIFVSPDSGAIVATVASTYLLACKYVQHYVAVRLGLRFQSFDHNIGQVNTVYGKPPSYVQSTLIYLWLCTRLGGMYVCVCVCAIKFGYLLYANLYKMSDMSCCPLSRRANILVCMYICNEFSVVRTT